MVLDTIAPKTTNIGDISPTLVHLDPGAPMRRWYEDRLRYRGVPLKNYCKTLIQQQVLLSGQLTGIDETSLIHPRLAKREAIHDYKLLVNLVSAPNSLLNRLSTARNMLLVYLQRTEQRLRLHKINPDDVAPKHESSSSDELEVDRPEPSLDAATEINCNRTVENVGAQKTGGVDLHDEHLGSVNAHSIDTDTDPIHIKHGEWETGGASISYKPEPQNIGISVMNPSPPDNPNTVPCTV
jgi:hypothetical protein